MYSAFSWPPKAKPLYFTAVIYLFIYFVNIDERPAMRSQPNLASSSEVVSIYICPTKNLGLSPKIWGAKNIFWTTFSAISALETVYLRNETSHGQTKILLSIYNVSPTRWPTFHYLWPRNGWDPFAYCDAAAIMLQPSKLWHLCSWLIRLSSVVNEVHCM